MKVKIKKSDYSMISVGMEGEAKLMSVPNNTQWYEVIFQGIKNPVPGYTDLIGGEFIGAFQEDQLEFLEDDKILPPYDEFVEALCKSGNVIKADITGLEAHVWHMSSALMGECGELFDCLKKAIIYRKPLDSENLMEELGDIEFYLQGIRNAYNINREDVINGNQEKLSKRYHKLTYSDQHAQERADKQP